MFKTLERNYRARRTLLPKLLDDMRYFGFTSPRLDIRYRNISPNRFVARVAKTGPETFELTINWCHTAEISPFMIHRLVPTFKMLARHSTTIPEFTLDVSDGNRVSDSVFGWSSNKPEVTLITDPLFLIHRAFETEAAIANKAPEWPNRSQAIRWRGGPNGTGLIQTDMASMFNTAVKQRIRLVLAAKTIPHADVRLISYPYDPVRKQDPLAALIGDAVEETSWANDRYAIDIDGWTNTWTNLLIRLHFGCCVLKVDSQFGYRQWYYDRIRPWEHFVPVRADMADLAEKVAWVRSHDREAQDIAKRGQAFARSMTFDGESDLAFETIRQRLSLA